MCTLNNSIKLGKKYCNRGSEYEYIYSYPDGDDEIMYRNAALQIIRNDLDGNEDFELLPYIAFVTFNFDNGDSVIIDINGLSGTMNADPAVAAVGNVVTIIGTNSHVRVFTIVSQTNVTLSVNSIDEIYSTSTNKIEYNP